MASFGVFGSYLIIETSQKWGRILWNPWQCKLKLKHMKNPSFGTLHNPLPSQSEMQGRKPEEEIQQPTFSHGCTKFRTPCETTWGNQRISHTMRNFAWYAKSSCGPTPLDFYLQIFCVISYFLLVIKIDFFFYIFTYLLCVTSGTHRDVRREHL